MIFSTVQQHVLATFLIVALFHTVYPTAGRRHRSHEKRDLLADRGVAEMFQAEDTGLMYNDATGSVVPVNPQKCVDIPLNMSLCQGIGYSQMLIPNLMEHETVREANEQSQTWMPLANIKCHQHTRLFLCSLFAPICPMHQPANSENGPLIPLTDQIMIAGGPVIYPCRSLCESVKQGCQGVMSKHGFPWPEMLSCARFPPDNDMCISPNPVGSGDGDTKSDSFEHVNPTVPSPSPATTTQRMPRTRRPAAGSRATSLAKTFIPTTTPVYSTTTSLELNTEHCPMCTFVVAPHQMDAAFCKAEFVAKVRFRRFTRRGVFIVKRPKIIKLARKLTTGNQTALEEAFKNAKAVELLFEPEKTTNRCRHQCAEKVELRSQLYLIMGVFLRSKPNLTKPTVPQIGIQLVLPWFSGENSRDFRQAEKRLQNLKCTTRPDGSQLHAGSSKKTQRGKKAKQI